MPNSKQVAVGESATWLAMTPLSFAIDMLLFAGAGLATLVALQRRLIYAPPRKVRHLAMGPYAGLYERRKLRLDLPDGHCLEGFASRPKYVPPGAPTRVLLYFGGRKENVEWVPDIASHLPDWHIYAFNHRGFGQSTGVSSERLLKHDAVLIHTHVIALHDDEIHTLAVMGRSLGTVVATWLASRFRVDRLVLVSPFRSLSHVLKRQPVIRWLTRLLFDQLDAGRHAVGVRSPTLVIASNADTRVPAALSRDLARLVAGPAELRLVEGISHGALPRSFVTQTALGEFLRGPASIR